MPQVDFKNIFVCNIRKFIIITHACLLPNGFIGATGISLLIDNLCNMPCKCVG